MKPTLVFVRTAVPTHDPFDSKSRFENQVRSVLISHTAETVRV